MLSYGRVERLIAALQDDRSEVPLDVAALELARVEFPQLDPKASLIRLDNLAAEIQSKLTTNASGLDFIRATNQLLFEILDFRGDEQNYYDPRNSCLNSVLTRRLGIPITLSVLYIEIARRLSRPVYGVGLPGHFIVAYEDRNSRYWIDPFHGGRILSFADCCALAKETAGVNLQTNPAVLAPVNKRQILVRMLSNLKAIYLRGGAAGADAAGPGRRRDGDDPGVRPASLREDERTAGELGLGAAGSSDGEIGDEDAGDARHRPSRTDLPHDEGLPRRADPAQRDREPCLDAVEQREPPRPSAPAHPPPRRGEGERRPCSRHGRGGDEQQRAGGGGRRPRKPQRAPPRHARGGIEIEHDEPEAAGPEQHLGGLQRVDQGPRPHPERAVEPHAGGGERLGVERICGIDPGDGLAGARGARRDARGKPGATRAPRAYQLGHPPARQPTAERPVEVGEPDRQARARPAGLYPEAQAPSPAEASEQDGGSGHGSCFRLSFAFGQAGALNGRGDHQG